MKEEGGSASKAGATADVPLPNSSARKTLLDPYHDLASSIFDMADTPEMENTFLDAAKEGNYAKIESLLMRRNETIFSLDVRDKKTGNTALVWAAQRGHPKIVDLLLRYGADVTLRNFDCQTAVEVASPQIQQLLLTSAGIGGPHRNLRQASWQGDSNLVQKILEETQVDINCRNDEGLTPLLLLTRDVMLFEKIGSKLTADRPYDPHQVIEQLLSHRADPNAEDEEGKTALHYVAASKAKIASQLVTKLLEDGSDIESRDRRCFTPIHCASQSGNVDVVLSLLDGGCEANARGYAGTTPLHISAINGHDQVACALLRKGADVMLYDDSGLTPVDVAKTKKVKATLKHAWTEATQHREPRNLAPVREGSTRSLRGKNSRHTGEVVFDSLVSSSMNLESARLKRPGFSKRFDERGRRVDDVLPVPGDDNRATTNRAACPQASPRSPKTRRLTPIKAASPRKTPAVTTSSSLGAVKFGPGTKIHDGSSYSRHGSSSDKHQGLQKGPLDPAKFPSGGTQIPVTILDLDFEENLQDVKLRKVMHGPVGSTVPQRHTRHHSDPTAAESPGESESKGELCIAEEAASLQTVQIQEPLSDVAATSVPPTFVTQMHDMDLQSECLSRHSSPEPDDGISLVMGSQAPIATLKENFNIEESRVRTSSDSGLPADASKSSSLTSSGSNSSSGSPRVKEESRSSSTPREQTVSQSSEGVSAPVVSVDRSRPKSRGPPTRPKEAPPKPPVASDIVKVNFIAENKVKTPRTKPVMGANGELTRKNSNLQRNAPTRPSIPPKRASFGQTAKEQKQSSGIKIQSIQRSVQKNEPKTKAPPRPPKPSTSKPAVDKVVTKDPKAAGPSVRAMSASPVDSAPHPSPKPSEHKGPVIQDPFESLRREREEVTAEAEKPKPANARVKSAASKKSTPQKKDTRLVSAGKKKLKAKEPSDAKVTLNTSKRKGTAKQRKGKKDSMAISQNDNAAFVTGIGWHIEAARDGDVHAVVMQHEDSSDSAEDVLKVAPNYDAVLSPMIARKESANQDKLRRSLEFNESHIPGQPARMEESEEEGVEEGEVEVAEVMCEEVVFTEAEPYEDMLLVAELKARAEEALDRSKVIPQTVKAIEDFSQSVLKEDLHQMLEGDVVKPTRILVKEACSPNIPSPMHTSISEPTALSAVEETQRPPVHRSSSMHSSPSKAPSSALPSPVHQSPLHRSSSMRAAHPRPSQPSSAQPNVYATQTSPVHRPLIQASPMKSTTSSANIPSTTSSANLLSASSSAKLNSTTSSAKPLPATKPSSSSSSAKPPSTTSTKPYSTQPTPQPASTTSPSTQPETLQSTSAQPDNTSPTKASTQSQPCPELPSTSSTTGIPSQSLPCSAQPPRPVKQRSSRAPSKKQSRAPRTRQQEEQDINHMIDEILKSTPDPTLSLSWRTGKKLAGKMKGMTEEQLAKELRNSQGATFERIPNDATDKKAEESDPGSFGEEEMETIEKLAHALKNLPLKVTDDSDDSETEAVVGKPPKAPKNKSVVCNAKSPRFVRKHDSLHRPEPVAKELDDWSDSEFGSTFSLPALQDDSLVPTDRGGVVTSRLGRRNSSSRAPSAMTNETEEVETIQWKRGNMLGKGAYGTVWCGLTNTGGLIAVKQIELNTDNMNRAEMEYEKIQEEVELLKNLNHSNIVGYLGTSLEEHIVSIFMEFVPGGSIANLLARFGALEEEVFCHYTRQILEGVQYLHSNNVIHRDIKGGNIMLMPNSEIKLIDFGCAKRLCLNMSVGARNKSSSHNRLLKSMRGTPYWMAPEVVKEEGHGTRSDIWSIGCTVFEMASRKPPWSEMPPMAAIFAIGSDSKPVPQLPEKFSPEARQFVQMCLRRDQNKRPSAAQMLNHPFIAKRKKSRIS